MALALIGGMSLGTVVSLFFIPLAYWFIYRKSDRIAESGEIEHKYNIMDSRMDK